MNVLPNLPSCPSHQAVRADGPDEYAPIDITTIQHTTALALLPIPVGARLDPKAITQTAHMLQGHIHLLLPIVEARHPELTSSVSRRLEDGIPNGNDYPACALGWVQESARTCRQLLGLASEQSLREQQHTAATAR